jgi:hypothetical protein
LGCWLFGFVCFGAQMKRIYCKEKNTQLGKQGPPLGSYWHFDSHNLKANIARLGVII